MRLRALKNEIVLEVWNLQRLTFGEGDYANIEMKSLYDCRE